MQRYNKTAAAKYLKIGRTTLYRWLEGSPQTVFTPKDLDRMAQVHGRAPPGQQADGILAADVRALHQTVDHLVERVTVLEATQHQAVAPRATRVGSLPVLLADPPKNRTTRTMHASSEQRLPPPVRTLVARWVAEHGGKENTIRRWEDLPLEPRAALMFVQDRMIALGYRVGHARLQPCLNPQCVCHEVLADGPKKGDNNL